MKVDGHCSFYLKGFLVEKALVQWTSDWIQQSLRQLLPDQSAGSLRICYGKIAHERCGNFNVTLLMTSATFK